MCYFIKHYISSCKTWSDTETTRAPSLALLSFGSHTTARFFVLSCFGSSIKTRSFALPLQLLNKALILVVTFTA